MHWKLYSACGRDHDFLEGMYSLHAVAIYYERRHAAESSAYDDPVLFELLTKFCY